MDSGKLYRDVCISGFLIVQDCGPAFDHSSLSAWVPYNTPLVTLHGGYYVTSCSAASEVATSFLSHATHETYLVLGVIMAGGQLGCGGRRFLLFSAYLLLFLVLSQTH